MHYIKNLACFNFVKHFFCHTKKSRLLSATLAFLLTISLFISVSYAQSQSVANSLAQAEQSGDELIQTEDTIAIEEIATAVNPENPYSPTVLPGNVLYPMKNMWRGLKAAFTFNNDKKADLRLKYSNEKIIELNSLADLGMMNKVASELPNYAKELEKIEALITKTRKENPQLAVEITKRVMQNQIHHHVVGNKFERNTPVEFLTDIRKSKDKVTNSIGSLISNLGTPADIQKALENDVENLLDKGTEFKQIVALGALKTVGEKVSLNAKDAFENVDKEYTFKVNERLDKASSETKDKFVAYASKNSGDEVTQAQILDDLSVINIDDDSYEKLVKTKENLYKNFNTRLADAEKNSPEAVDGILEHLDNGEVKDLRILKDLERNVTDDKVKDKIQSVKEKSLKEFSSKIGGADKKEFLDDISDKSDIKQLAVLNEIEKASNISDASTAEKIDQAKAELVKKIGYSVNLMSYSDVQTPVSQTTVSGETVPSLPQQSIKKAFASCISGKMCSNIKNIDPEDIKTIEENKRLFGDQLTDRLTEINKQKIMILIKTAEDLRALSELENKVRANIDDKEFKKYLNEMNNQTAYIGEISQPATAIAKPVMAPINQIGQEIDCPFDYKPVCGIDGRTYTNQCFAEKMSNVKIEYEGGCKLRYFTDTGETVLCEKEYNPVCGVDNREYSNRCYAEKVAKMQIKNDGPCVYNISTTILNYPTGQPAATPVVTQIDSVCFQEYNPVCGVDNRTYQNFCYAEKIAHVAVAYKGKCENTLSGTTVTVTPYTPIATCYPEYNPVCGVDGRTYQSYCFAEKINNVKVAYPGKCGEPTNTIAPSEPTILIPQQEVSSRTMLCPTEYRPVCGYDNRSYANRCQAEQIHKVQVQYEGECKTNVATCNYNKICDNNNGETNASCPSDCVVNTNMISCPSNDYTNADGKCNFTKCQNGCVFNSSGCPVQCSAPLTAVCNYNGICDSTETTAYCPNDCPVKTLVGSTCPINEFTNADGKCSYTKCPNGCVFNSSSCPVQCSTPLTAVCNYNGICENTETTAYCPNDCPIKTPVVSTCPLNESTNADGKCNFTKCPNGCTFNSSNCPTQCYTPPTVVCNYNKICDNGESATNCASDCGSSETMCEDNTTMESCISNTTCKWLDIDKVCKHYSVFSGETDSGTLSTYTYCGDGTCASDESSSNCEIDCPIKTYCGDGICNSSESNNICPADCGSNSGVKTESSEAFCGDGSCNGSESNSICSVDCYYTVGSPYCGDGACTDSETYESCYKDCTPSTESSDGLTLNAERAATTYKKLSLIRQLFIDIGEITKSILLLTVNAISRN